MKYKDLDRKMVFETRKFLMLFFVICIGNFSFSQSASQSKSPGEKKLKVLVTGHLGYVGSAFVKAFGNKYDIVGYDLLEGDDILDYDQLKRRMKGVDVVVHEAAIPAPVPGKNFNDYFRTNVEGTANVARAAYESGVKRLIYASSTTIYGIEGGIPFSYPISEGQSFVSQYLKADDLHTRDIDLSYHMSKVMAEQIIAWYGLNKKMETIVLRYGPIDKVNMGTHVSLENVVQATDLAVSSKDKFWYEAFSIVDGDVDFIDISKARKMLLYDPKPVQYNREQIIAPFQDRLKLGH
ncbi:NAD-dependent epimerase/dehydratase family protein [Chryseobacterium aureum]|uniref:NAD-dependent epimerase/dehydratase family protein n=1 Tax=Chryseobacterium aureum TaxID=2497456 RepID=UPI000F882EDE|nr:NAD(P)-dependent oxidoreductase [Chryseobacterium aureum]